MEKFVGFNHVELWHKFPFTLLRFTSPDAVQHSAGDDGDEEMTADSKVLPDLLLPQQSKEVCLSREKMPRSFVGIWCLRAETHYEALLDVITESGTRELTSVRFRTNPSPFQGTDWPQFVADAPHLSDVNILDCCSEQNSDWLIAIKDLSDTSKLLSTRYWFCKLFYNALFALPSRPPVINMPNGRSRYVLDLSLPINWTSSKKVRRAISSNKYAVVANRNLRASLNDAFFYHSSRGSTWLTHAFIDVLCDIHDNGEAPYGLQMMAVELWDKEARVPVAGCLGFCVGSAYHDFTMYTLRRDEDSCGTLVTKVLGAALQAAGYGMWYWGFRVAYMEQYEGKYGAIALPRRTFLKRWVTLREELPLVPVHQFINAGKGLLPAA